ncbi:MAG TPA: membrane protein insertion efficiency factor YidD [Candidatus Magasanikbacteria bacterium]|nr:membrane protein insertion efficiency factor YidD [Candidatus Magasanikbacteria bacterium]
MIGGNWQYLILMPRLLVLRAIRFYQKHFSPDHSRFSILHPYGFCRFKPTCSEYGYQAIEKYGLIKGGLMATGRILRCHPWSKGGWDPVK